MFCGESGRSKSDNKELDHQQHQQVTCSQPKIDEVGPHEGVKERIDRMAPREGRNGKGTFVPPPPFVEAVAPNKGFVTAADEEDEVTEVLFWDTKKTTRDSFAVLYDFTSNGGRPFSPRQYFDAEARRQSTLSAAEEPPSDAPHRGANDGPVETAFDDVEAADKQLDKLGQQVKALNTRLYDVQTELLSTAPRERKRLRREAQSLEDELLQVRYRLEATVEYIKSVRGGQAGSEADLSVAQQGPLEAAATEDSEADELEMEAVARLARRGADEITGFHEEAIFWCGLGASGGFLLQCLRARDFDEDAAIAVAANFAAFRASSGWGLEITVREMEAPLHSGAFWLMPGMDHAGRGVVVVNLRYLEPRLCGWDQYMQAAAFVVQEAVKQRKRTQEMGLTLVVDCSDSTMRMLRSLSHEDVRRAVVQWQDNFPCKLGRVFILGLGSITSRVCKWALEFLPSKIQARVAILGKKKISLLHAEVPVSVLPTSLGGDVDAELLWTTWVRCKVDEAESPEGEFREEGASSQRGQGLLNCL